MVARSAAPTLSAGTPSERAARDVAHTLDTGSLRARKGRASELSYH
jgi:hypothetical protein